MTRFIPFSIALALAGCTSHLSQEVKADAKVETTAAVEEHHEEEKVTTAPVRIETDDVFTTPATAGKPAVTHQRHKVVTLAPVATAKSTVDIKSQDRADTEIHVQAEKTKDSKASLFGLGIGWWLALVAGAAGFLLYNRRELVAGVIKKLIP